MKTAEQRLLEAVYTPTPKVWKEDITTNGEYYTEAKLEIKDHVLCITQHTESGDGEVYLTISQIAQILASTAKYYESHEDM